MLRLGEMLRKYDLLIELRRGQPGRTPARREAMRAIAERFPAALREWDGLPLAELVRRREVVHWALASAGAAGPAPLDRLLAAPEHAWLRYALDLHEHLREALRLRRPIKVAYAEVAARHGVSVAALKHALFSPALCPKDDHA